MAGSQRILCVDRLHQKAHIKKGELRLTAPGPAGKWDLELSSSGQMLIIFSFGRGSKKAATYCDYYLSNWFGLKTLPSVYQTTPDSYLKPTLLTSQFHILRDALNPESAPKSWLNWCGYELGLALCSRNATAMS